MCFFIAVKMLQILKLSAQILFMFRFYDGFDMTWLPIAINVMGFDALKNNFVPFSALMPHLSGLMGRELLFPLRLSDGKATN